MPLPGKLEGDRQFDQGAIVRRGEILRTAPIFRARSRMLSMPQCPGRP